MKQTGILLCVLYIVIVTIRYGSATNCESIAYQVCNPTTFSDLEAYKECWLSFTLNCYSGSIGGRTESDCTLVPVPQAQELCWENPSPPYKEECTMVEYTVFICLVN